MTTLAKRKPLRRGKKWAKLKVSFKVDAPAGSHPAVKRDAILAALEQRPLPDGCRIARVSWENPDANWKRSIEYPDEAWLRNERKGLPTLNRGGWLKKQLLSFFPDVPVIRKRRKAKKVKSKRKKTRKIKSRKRIKSNRKRKAKIV